MTDSVVLSGSLGSTRAIWDAQVRALGGHKVLPFDHPGHGAAPVEEFDGVGDLARRIVDQVTEEKFSFVGLSLGGAIGMRIALDAPDRLDRLVLACTSARFSEPDFWLERADAVRTGGIEAIVDLVLQRWFTPRFADVSRYRSMLLSIDPEGYARCCEALAEWDIREELGKIRTHTLVIAGAEDPSTPPSHGELIASRIPGARFEVLQGAAHIANVERADEFNELLVQHL